VISMQLSNFRDRGIFSKHTQIPGNLSTWNNLTRARLWVFRSHFSPGWIKKSANQRHMHHLLF
jgi:hypothetical protein